MKISFLCFDISGNSFGRAALLAQALADRFEVELVGPARCGGIWPPLKDTRLKVKLFPWRRYPGFLDTIRGIRNAIDGDVIYACKLRPTSFGIGLLETAVSGKPLLVDIDDWELGFFYRAGFWGKVGRFLNLSNPNGLPYTWLMEKLVSRADGISVSNRFLQNRFGGELIYHCRDTEALDPAKYDTAEAKRVLGLDGRKVLMFLGTPRAHKGLDELAAIMQRIKDPQACLAIVGAGENDLGVLRTTGETADRIKIFPTMPFAQLGQYLAAADIVLVPQRLTSDTVGQMPAKIFDAMAMAKPIVSTTVSDIPEVLQEVGYVVEPGNVGQMADMVEYILSHMDEAKTRGQNARRRCIELYDIKVMGEKLAALIGKCATKKMNKKSRR